MPTLWQYHAAISRKADMCPTTALDRRKIADQAVNQSRVLSIRFLAGIRFRGGELLMHIALHEGRHKSGFTK
jgi:hypothetical protein